MIGLHAKLNNSLANMTKEELEEYTVHLIELLDSYRDIIRALDNKVNDLENLYKDQKRLSDTNEWHDVVIDHANEFAESIRRKNHFEE